MASRLNKIRARARWHRFLATIVTYYATVDEVEALPDAYTEAVYEPASAAASLDFSKLDALEAEERDLWIIEGHRVFDVWLSMRSAQDWCKMDRFG